MKQENIELLNNLNQQHEMLTEQLRLVEQQINEIGTFDRELDALEHNKNSEILAPIGKSVFAFMKPNPDQKFFVDVGSGYFVRKDIKETKSVAAEQKHRLEMFRVQLSEELQNVIAHLEEMITSHHAS